MKRGEIWLVDLTDARGHEQGGERPALTMGQANGLVAVVPFTTNLRTIRFSHTVSVPPAPYNGLDRESVALVFQIVALDRERFIHRIGNLDEQELQVIAALVKDLLNLDE